VKGSVFLADFATTVGDLADTVTRPAQ
jgi:hypothetical protein